MTSAVVDHSANHTLRMVLRALHAHHYDTIEVKMTLTDSKYYEALA